MKYYLLDENDNICGEFNSPVAAELYAKELERKGVTVWIIPEKR